MINERCETSAKDIYACGDCAEYGINWQLWSQALEQGRVAGINAAGGFALWADPNPDAADAQMMRSQLRDQLAGMESAVIGDSWNKWNLERMGYEANSATSPKAFDESSLPED